ncbi:MAG: VWA domain-containing protein [Acidobacteria bacterium]|nr:VWA domain-containing protein [Acidobacteriota bacterium]MCI0624704.1 VWA domain-containing protein [Acidobacteriota bacterium]MCI0717905.1 VWA domain-containing protein [Acidobacteriota bacterium]
MSVTSRNKKQKISAALALVILVLTVMPSGAKESQRESRPVSLFVTVEENGGLVTGLTAENFRVLENDRPRAFQLQELNNPASIVLLVEYSQSSWLYLEDIRRALQGFLSHAPEGHWYALATFAHELSYDVDFTKQKGKLTAAFSDLGQPMWNEIDTYDAVYQILDRMERLKGRRVLIFIGSGFDTFSGHTLDDVQKKLESTNVLVYGAGTGSLLRGYYNAYLGSFQRMELLQAEAFVKMLADKSGGQAWFPRFETAFPDVLKGIFQTLQHHYKLEYQSQIPADGEFHEIEVEAFQVKDDKRHDFKVRVREGWRF